MPAAASVSQVSGVPNPGAPSHLPHQAFYKAPTWSPLVLPPTQCSLPGRILLQRPLASFPADAQLVHAASAGSPALDVHLSSESLRCLCEVRGGV